MVSDINLKFSNVSRSCCTRVNVIYIESTISCNEFLVFYAGKFYQNILFRVVKFSIIIQEIMDSRTRRRIKDLKPKARSGKLMYDNLCM
jgi:DNA-directed RNA polymerase subunit E'/Rpb7